MIILNPAYLIPVFVMQHDSYATGFHASSLSYCWTAPSLWYSLCLIYNPSVSTKPPAKLCRWLCWNTPVWGLSYTTFPYMWSKDNRIVTVPTIYLWSLYWDSYNCMHLACLQFNFFTFSCFKSCRWNRLHLYKHWQNLPCRKCTNTKHQLCYDPNNWWYDCGCHKDIHCET